MTTTSVTSRGDLRWCLIRYNCSRGRNSRVYPPSHLRESITCRHCFRHVQKPQLFHSRQKEAQGHGSCHRGVPIPDNRPSPTPVPSTPRDSPIQKTCYYGFTTDHPPLRSSSSSSSSSSPATTHPPLLGRGRLTPPPPPLELLLCLSSSVSKAWSRQSMRGLMTADRRVPVAFLGSSARNCRNSSYFVVIRACSRTSFAAAPVSAFGRSRLE